MKYRKKYTKGEQITSLDELARQKFIFFRDKITHNGWFMSWQFRLAQIYINQGYLFYAIKNQELDICEGYCGISCVDGSCPIANAEEYAERDYDIIHNCGECGRYQGCNDYAFSGTDMCYIVCKDGKSNG